MKRALSIVFPLGIFVCVALAAQGPQNPPAGAQGTPAAGGDAPARGRGAITPRILSFEADRTTIKPGESVVLSWATEAGAATIDNGVGPVFTRGAVKLTPKATTTYTMSMGGGAVTRSVTVTVEGTTPVPATPATDAAADTPIPRIGGKPDFSGIYGGFIVGGGRGARGAPAPAAPPSPYANVPAQPTLKPGVQNQAVANPMGRYSDCLPLPANSAFDVPYPFQIFQNPKYLIFVHEYPGTFRIIPIDEPHPPEPDLTWMGDSVAHWEGDTLVIDTIAYNGRQPIGGIQEPSESFRTIERLTKTSATGFFYEIIFEDPEKTTGQWRATRTFNADTRRGLTRVLEFVCENNRDYTPLFGPQGPPPAGAGRGAQGGTPVQP